MEKEWGPATRNPETGLPEFFWKDGKVQWGEVGSALGSIGAAYLSNRSAKKRLEEAEGAAAAQREASGIDRPLEQLEYRRYQRPYEGDYFTYGQGGGEHNFFTEGEYVPPGTPERTFEMDGERIPYSEVYDRGGVLPVRPLPEPAPVTPDAAMLAPYQELLQKYNLGNFIGGIGSGYFNIGY